MFCFRFLVATIASFAVLSAAVGQQPNLPKAESNVSGRGHLRVGCTTCHSIHSAKGAKTLFALDPNAKAVNPTTKKPFEGVSAVCLSCHANAEQGGLGMVPVSAAHSHPMGREVNPKVAKVSEEFLRDGKLECVGCHDPHTSNPNWALLRVDTDQGKNMDEFCAMCHASKAHASTLVEIKKMPIFSSMDETKLPPARPAAKAAAPAAAPSSPPPAVPEPPATTPAPKTPPAPGTPPAGTPPAGKD